MLQCGRGWTLQNTALYAEIKPPTQTPHRQRPRPGVSPARRRTTAQRPGPGDLGPRGAGHVGRAALAAMSLQGLGRTGPAPGRALECAGGRPTGQAHPFANRKGGKKSLHCKRRYKKTETHSNHYMNEPLHNLLCPESPALYSFPCARSKLHSSSTWATPPARLLSLKSDPLCRPTMVTRLPSGLLSGGRKYWL